MPAYKMIQPLLNKVNIPTLAKWQSDSSVALTVRKSDPVLHRIDFLISAFHEAPLYLVRGIACDLYFSIDYWLAQYKSNSAMSKGRQPAMYALYKSVVDFLCATFNCTVNVLPRELDLMFGRELSELGFKFDFEHGKARYLQRKELDKHRIWFRDGRAYRWATPPAHAARIPVNSKEMHNPEAFVVKPGQRPNADYAAFILTMDRRLYMGRHEPGTPNKFDGFYHSSYIAGQTVMAAGSMLIRDGRILRIRSDSGHYKPVDTNMLQLLQTLKMVGVPIHNIFVEDFLGGNAVRGPVFWVANGDWYKMTKHRDENLALRRNLHSYKEERRNPRTGGVEPANLPYGEEVEA